jgi:uncharacterized protein YwqG
LRFNPLAPWAFHALIQSFARADGWQHVLQIETDSEVGPWIGEGCLYVCIRKSDLAERRFDRRWTMPQCT